MAAARKKRIVILATGGTIAGVGEPGCDTGYVSGQMAAEDLRNLGTKEVIKN